MGMSLNFSCLKKTTNNFTNENTGKIQTLPLTTHFSIPKFAQARYVSKRALLVHKIRDFVSKELKEATKKNRVPLWKQVDANGVLKK
jgi:hypothetical protein